MSTFGETFQFFGRLGVYEILLPFLLVFTLVFAILEKTAILGFDEVKGKKYTKKNQNSMIAFVIAFIVVASSEIVRVINQIIADTIILLVASVMFLMLAGSFHGQEDGGFFLSPDKEGRGWVYWSFMIIMFVGIVLIFMNAIGWLDAVYYYLTTGFNSSTVGSIIVILIFLGIIMFVTHSKDAAPPAKKED